MLAHPINITPLISQGVEKEPLLFEITAAHISDDNAAEKKHIIYTLQVRHASGLEDSAPSTIERRYTHFHNLYNDVRAEHPQLMSAVAFPKKVLLGNFDNKLISERSTAFEALLKFISSESKLRSSLGLLKFLQDLELRRAKTILEQRHYSEAYPLLEHNFRLLNKVYTDRSPAVLIALCRLLACSCMVAGAPDAPKWADLALHRYEAVSDSDLLELYVPLLKACLKVWWQLGRDREVLERRLEDLRRRGVRVTDSVGLLEAVEELEKRLFRQ